MVSSDVLRAVAAAEVARPAMQGDRMTALASHLVCQRRCPPPAFPFSLVPKSPSL